MLCASRRTRTEPRTRTESPRRARGRNQVDRRRFGGRPLCQVVTASNRRRVRPRADRADRSRFIDGRNPRLLSAVVWFFRKRTLRSIVRRHGQNVERHGLLLRRRPRGAPRRRVHARSAPRPHPRRDDETPRARRPSPPRRRRGVVRGGRDRPEGARATRHRSRSFDRRERFPRRYGRPPSTPDPAARPPRTPTPPSRAPKSSSSAAPAASGSSSSPSFSSPAFASRRSRARRRARARCSPTRSRATTTRSRSSPAWTCETPPRSSAAARASASTRSCRAWERPRSLRRGGGMGTDRRRRISFQARSISRRSPYDRVGVVNVVP